MKGIIIYKGKYGSTQQYAEWLGIELNTPVIPAGIATGKSIVDADFVIIGTSVYMGKLQIRNWLKTNRDDLVSKKIFFFLVAGTPPDQKDKLDGYIQANVPDKIRQIAEVFYLPGRLILRKLSWLDRFLLKMAARLNKDPQARTAMSTEYDNVKKNKLSELINAIRAFNPAKSKSVAQ